MLCNSLFTRTTLALSLVVLAGMSAVAQRPAQQEAATRQVSNSAGTNGKVSYEPGDVHLDASRVYIHVYKTGLGHEHGVVGMLKQGQLRLDPSGGGELVFDMKSFAADSDAARKFVGLTESTDASTRQQVNANMHGPAVLDTQSHPTATFKITSVTKLAKVSRRNLPQYQLEGDFTLHGVTNSIRVIADAEPKQSWLHVRGGFAILQSNYGIKPFKKAFGAVGVADRLDIWGDLWIARERVVVDRTARR